LTSSLHAILETAGAIFSNQTTFGTIFAHAHIFRNFAKVFTDIAQICPDFTISKLIGVPLHPYVTAPVQTRCRIFLQL